MTNPKTWTEQMKEAGATLPVYTRPQPYSIDMEKLDFILAFAIADRHATKCLTNRVTLVDHASDLYDLAVKASI